MSRSALCAVAALAAGLIASACGAGQAELRIGAVFPLSGPTAGDARDEYLGAVLAARMVNASGGVAGKQIALDTRNVHSTDAVQRAADSLRRDRVTAVIGAYSSQLWIPLAAGVAQDGLGYLGAGGGADRVTGQGQPVV